MNKNILIAILVFALGISGGLLLAKKNNPRPIEETTKQQPQSTATKVQSENTPSDLDKMITYTVPTGLVKASCDNTDAVYFVNTDSSADCSSNPDTKMTLEIDPKNTIDCNQLQGRTEVRKHICISLYINDQRSLQATTEYLSSSSYGKDITSQEYYVDTGNGIVKAQYLYTGNGNNLKAFEDLVNTIVAK